MLRDFVVGHHLYFTHDVNLYLTNFFFAFLQHPVFFLSLNRRTIFFGTRGANCQRCQLGPS
jgi:hypothetical protein